MQWSAVFTLGDTHTHTHTNTCMHTQHSQSCLIKRFCEKRFVSKYMATLGIDFGVSSMKVGDHNVKVNIFDMAGQPFFYEVHVTDIFWV